jgi:hypothetical protein
MFLLDIDDLLLHWRELAGRLSDRRTFSTLRRLRSLLFFFVKIVVAIGLFFVNEMVTTSDVEKTVGSAEFLHELLVQALFLSANGFVILIMLLGLIGLGTRENVFSCTIRDTCRYIGSRRPVRLCHTR